MTTLVAQIFSGDKIVGMRLANIDFEEINEYVSKSKKEYLEAKCKDVSISNIKMVMERGTAVEGIELKCGELSGSNGAFSRYAKLNTNGELTGGNDGESSPLVVVADLWGEGYAICDFKGRIRLVSKDTALRYAQKNGIANGKVVSRDGEEFISSIQGTYKRIDKDTAKIEDTSGGEVKEEEVANVNKKEELPSYSESNLEDGSLVVDKAELKNGSVRIISYEPWYEGKKLVDEKYGITVEQKVARVAWAIKAMNPFAYAILNGLDQIPIKDSAAVPTCGVTHKKLYYNCEFVRKVTLAELLFVFWHEIMHVAQLHPLRGKNKNHQLWNVATDLYINKQLCEQFGISANGSAHSVTNEMPIVSGKLGKGLPVGTEVAFLVGGLYNPNINTEKDAPETIYEEIEEQYKKEKEKMEQQQGEGDGSDSNGSSGSSSDGQNGEGQSQGANSNSSNGNKSGNKKSGEGSQSDGGEGSAVVVDYKGTKIKICESGDIVYEQADEGKSESALKQEAKGVLNNAAVSARQAGMDVDNWMFRQYEKIQAPRVDFRPLIRRNLLQISAMDRSFKCPDKRYVSRGMTLPGKTALEPDKLKGVKICIDTSGSIDEKDLGMAMNIILQLLNQFKASGEIIFWDTRIRGKSEFKDAKEAVKARPAGGGGTDVTCVFEYLENRRLCKVPASIVIVITDGYFSISNESKWRNKYKDTIWILPNEGYEHFKAPFGKKAPLKNTQE